MTLEAANRKAGQEAGKQTNGHAGKNTAGQEVETGQLEVDKKTANLEAGKSKARLEACSCELVGE